MPQKVVASVENNFTKGLITEFTGLNFPENAATDTDNCEYTLVGDVRRRLGITYEENFTDVALNTREGQAVNTYKWNNAGGDGNTQIVVVQIGPSILFYRSSSATTAVPLSHQKLGSFVDMTSYVPPGGTFDNSQECQFSDGNGYLLIYHPNCEPVYCTYVAGTVTGYPISIQVRDFVGAIDNLIDNVRPSALTDAHNYNLQNQGWISGSAWSLSSNSVVTLTTGAKSFTVPSGVTGISGGQLVQAVFYLRDSNTPYVWMTGTVTSYVGTTFTMNSVGTSPPGYPPTSSTAFQGYWIITPIGTGYVNTWFTSQGNYPSNADVWWRFKNASNVFDPTTTQPNVSISLGPAPRGHFIFSAFVQDRGLSSGVSNLTVVSTTARPSNGCWFQGRAWYTGVNASQAANGTAPYTTWTEKIYFSQIVNKADDFGKCYQTNDPTSEELFDILPTDGGVIVIQGSGPIYKLFPIQNGLLVFAANGVWFITGSQGIGFSASDYTITKLSSVESISSSSYVDVEGLPYFWNEDGIYQVKPQQGGGLSVVSLTFNTISSYYDEIPLESKKLARGVYHPIDFRIQWLFKSENGADTTERYVFDKILNLNTTTQAFYPYSVSPSGNQGTINGILYVQGPGGSDSPLPVIKYLTSIPAGGTYTWTFADEHSTDYVDWGPTTTAVDYTSYFVTGYKIRGQAINRFYNQYLQIWSNVSDEDTGYKIQGLWDYSTSGNSGRWTTIQNISIPGTENYGSVFRRHKIRGNGFALQFKVSSQTAKAFDISGWATVDTINSGT